MQRALTAGELVHFRNRPQRTRWYLAVHQPETIFSAQIQDTPQTWPASTINFNVATISGNPSGASGDMTAWLGNSAGGSEGGKIRLREFDRSSLGATDGSVLHIAESGSGLLRQSATKWVTVKDEFYPWTKHINFNTETSQWRMDYNLEYASELHQYAPLVIMGPPVAGFLDGGTFTASFVGENTQFLGSTENTWNWVFPAGSAYHPSPDTDKGTATSPVTRVFANTASPGGRYFSLIVNDSTGTSSYGRRLIYTFNDRTGPARVTFAQISGGLRGQGYRASVKVYAGADTTAFPEGAEVLIFDESSYGGAGASIGGNYPFRTNVVMRGWISEETVLVNPFSGEVTFKVDTINDVLNKIEAFSIFLTHTDAPSNLKPWLSETHLTGTSEWVQAEDLSVDRVTQHWARHRSTVGQITDVRLSSASDGGPLMSEEISFQELPKSTMWEQLKQNYHDKGVKGYVAADMQSTIWCDEDAQISGLSATLPLTMTIKKGDRADTVSIPHRHHELNARVEIGGVKSYLHPNSTSSWRGDLLDHIGYMAESPGTVQGYFGKQQKHTRGLVTPSQQALTVWAGNWRAQLNNPYDTVSVPLSGYLKLDAVPQSRVQMTLSPVDNIRGLDWDNKQFFPHTLTLGYDSETGTVKTTVQMEAVVDGRGGSAITFPPFIESTNPNGGGTGTAPDPDPYPDGEPTMGDGQGTAYVMTSNRLFRTDDLSAGSPSWENLRSGGYGDFILDPWSPGTTAYLLGIAGDVLKTTNLNAVTPTWTTMLTEQEIIEGLGFAYGTFEYEVYTAVHPDVSEGAHKIIASINYNGYIAFTYKYGKAYNRMGIGCSYSWNGGATWNHVIVSHLSGVAPGGYGHIGAFDYVPMDTDDGSGHVKLWLATIRGHPILGTRAEIWKSTNSGATWTQTAFPWNDPPAANSRARVCHAPYQGNSAGNILYFGYNGTTNNRTYKTEDNGNTITQMLPAAGKFVSAARTGIASYTNARNQLHFWDDSVTLYTSSDSGNSWTQKNATNVTGATVCAAGGFPNNNQQFYVVTNTGVFLSLDGGNTFSNKTGDMEMNATYPTEIQGLHTGVWNRITRGAIVPNWLE